MALHAVAIAHENISDLVATEVRNMIVDGRIPGGARINEVHLSQQLGVSRTPLREALGKLVHEGALNRVPRIGYFVLPLTLEEFEQIYAIRPLLDPEALYLAGLPSEERFMRLKKINSEMSQARGAEQIIRLDDEFHLELIAACRNKVLIDLIQQFSYRTRRYELALMRDKMNVSHAVADHEKVLRELARGDLEAASKRLKENTLSGREPIVRWLREREGGGEA